MNGRILLTLAVPVLMLGGCHHMEVDEINKANLSGDDFEHELARDYRDFANFEAQAMYDYIDAGHFAQKGMSVANGENSLPEEPAQWGIEDQENLAELTRARDRLLAALAQGAAAKAPGPAARAQVQYDCWVEQQEEGHQFDHIAECREGFLRAIASTEEALTPEPAASREPAAPRGATGTPPTVVETEYMVFFAWDSAEINQTAAELLDRFATNLRNSAPRPILIVGHADRSGPADYNMELSERRADAVVDALSDRGIDKGRTTVRAEGETEPLVPTADGVRERQNRRVRIDLVGHRPGA